MTSRVISEFDDPKTMASRRSGEPVVQLLDPNTVNQIAAGEVVERPASVLKELIENAIDAQADRIAIELEDHGVTLISVADNGVGMSEQNAVLSLQRHATSKIREVEDLNQIDSLGFRGEALPSIASVSKFKLSTGTSDGARFQIEIVGGEYLSQERIAGPKGTTVTVEDLFFNTPARLKFLKSATTELGQCLDTVTRYALSFPSIAFTVRHNGQEALSTAGSNDLAVAIGGVWNRDLARALVEVNGEIAGIRISGFVSPPHLTKPTRAMQYIFVNGRPVKSRTLFAAIDQAYRMLTPERRFPVIVLCLDIDPSRIDVNVSPTKSEIKFQHEGSAFDAVRYSIKQALLDSGMIPSAEDIAIANDALAGGSPSGTASWQSSMAITGGGWQGSAHGGTMHWPTETVHGPLSEASVASQSPLSCDGIATIPTDGDTGSSFDPPIIEGFSPISTSRYPFGDLLDGLKVLGQILNTFIVAENRRGLVVIDQHVAHERVLYEYLCGLKGPTAIEVQRLLTPETLHLDKRSAILFRDQIGHVRDVGFDVEPFGGDSFVLRAAPAALRGKSPIKVLQDLVEELVESAVARRLTPTREAIWIMSSCKMAIKAGDPLSIAEMEKLISDLAQTENPYLCPHGRPITVTLGVDELLRKFGRK